MLNDIEWKEGAVCFAGGEQWFGYQGSALIENKRTSVGSLTLLYKNAINASDFHLNTIKKGDYIEASELDTEEKYNDAVGFFGLFGCERSINYNTLGLFDFCFIAKNGHIGGCSERHLLSVSHRKLTYSQIMAIGELKRLEIKRDKAVNVPPTHFIPKAGEYAVSDKELEKSAPKIAPDLTPDLVNNQEVKMQKNKPVVAQVMIDLTERMEIGIKTYGEALRANNGRDALQDAYEEALDLACYLKQAMIERDNENTN